MSTKSDCRKFTPNIFNKNKCAACFKAKEEHSDEALENNRASRKVAKCGYLFAAPDWDFSNPINRTKRWQRRWFVLYDDGELTYSVDEHPETVPQAIIDMNRVVEVSEAEEVTGHPFSLALTAADRVHFLKGTSREESKWWFDILSMFPRTNMKTGRHKRNATFPGSRATTVINPPQPAQQQSSTPNSPCMSKGVSIQPFQTPPMARPRFHSQTESIMTSSSAGRAGGGGNNTFNLLPVKDTNGRTTSAAATTTTNNNNMNNKMVIDEDDIIPVKEEPTNRTPASSTSSSSASLFIEKDIIIIDKDVDEKMMKTRRVIRREHRGARSARCNSEILSSMLIQPPPPSAASSSPLDLSIPDGSGKTGTTTTGTYALVLPGSTLTAPIGSLKSSNDRPRSSILLPPIPPATSPAPAIQQQQQQQSQSQPHSPFYLYMADAPRGRQYDSLDSLQQVNSSRLTTAVTTAADSIVDMRARHGSKDMPDALITAAATTITTTATATVGRKDSSASSVTSSSSRGGLLSPTGAYDAAAAAFTPRSVDHKEPGETVRGDPDGCGLDPVTSFCSPLPDRRRSLGLGTTPGSPLLPAGSSLLSDDGSKKGWLVRLSYGGEWKKYWFVLKSPGQCQLLRLYRDQATEEAGLMPEDVIDLAQVTSVDETDSGRSYGFQLLENGETGGVKRHSLAALTSGIRSQWIQVLRNACNLTIAGKLQTVLPAGSLKTPPGMMTEKKENADHPVGKADESFESLEESLGSSGDEDGDEDADEDEELDEEEEDGGEDDESISLTPQGSLADAGPPSPPVNRTPMSLVKERDRSRSSSRSRHRSGSPSFRALSPAGPILVQQSTGVDLSSSAAAALEVRLDAAKGEIGRLLTERRDQEKEAKKQLETLGQRLAEKEKQVAALSGLLEASKAETQRQLNDIRNSLEAKEAELRTLREESAGARAEGAELRESLKRERSEVYKLRDVAQELRSLLDSRNDTLNQLQSKTDEVESLNRKLKATQESLTRTQERLQRGIDENEGLFARLRQMEESGEAPGSSMGLRRSRSSTGSMPLPLQLCSRNLLGGSSKRSLARLDSLSDLSNIDYELDLEGMDRQALVDEYVDLRARFERSLTEIRALKRELKQTQSALDGFEVAQMSLKQQWAAKESDYNSQLNLMAARIEDLTSKMGSSDKQVRQLKIKVAKSESREKRRTQSLKGRESFQLSKDVEDKLVDLENKMAALGAGSAPTTPSSSAERETPPTRVRKGFEEPTKSFKMRRKSLEGGGGSSAAASAAVSSAASTDPVKILLRVDQLEQQVAGRSGTTPTRKISPSSSTSERKTSLSSRSPQGRPPRSSPLKSGTGSSSGSSETRKRSTEASPSPFPTIPETIPGVARSSKMVQDLEQCVVELELLFGSRKVDGQGLVNKIRDIQRELLNPAEAAASGGASPASGQAQVEKIQELLRLRLSELKVKRDHVRSMGKLDSAAVSQIAAEKLALELAMADQLMSGSGSSVAAGSRDSLRDAHWTVQKLSWLRRKLNGERTAPALEQSTTFGTYCAALAERLSAMAAVSSALRGANGGGSAVPDLLAGCASSLPAGVAQQLAEEEREMSELFAKYKEEKLQELARLLAHETLRMGDGHGEDNQLVEEVQVRQAWLEAQEVANKELVDSEVRQAMTRMAEVFAEDVATEERLAAALLLWPVQQVQYEHRCQVVEDVLRSEMEEAVLLLSNAYERSLLQMKADGLHQSAPAPEGDLEAVLSEFAEVVAHKALIDGHIAVLQGESPSTPLAVPSFFGSGQESVEQNVGIVQETESIIGDLSSCGSTSGEVFFPAVLNCAEVAAVLHRNLVEPRGPTRSDDTSSGASNEEAIRKKYQDEIEQLRALTEKGMSAMEGSHKRTIAQMEEKHQQELARLQVEKERALAEETQATLAALDAMRKAHEAEVQREIARFKEEFLSQMSSSRGRNGSGDVGGRNGRLGSTGASGGRDSHYAHRSPEREQEMEEIRREILSLNEKYSHKCLETAALEQKVSTMSQQLNMSQRQIGDLDARNQQLRAFLDAGQGPGTPGPSPQTPDGTTDQLRAKDSQLLMLQEDVAELQFCLRESQSREEELASLARNLGQYLRTDRPLRPDEVASLRHRLEDLLLLSEPRSRRKSSSAAVEGRMLSATSPGFSMGQRDGSLTSPSGGESGGGQMGSRFQYARSSKDLTRSPSCPRLTAGFLSLAPRLSVAARPVGQQTSSTPPASSNNVNQN